MKKSLLLIALATLSLVACSSDSPQAPKSVTTGIVGQALQRQSICDPSAQCEFPISSIKFQVLRDNLEISTFETDQDGKFQLQLPAGKYMIVYNKVIAGNPNKEVIIPEGPPVTVRLVWVNFP